MRIQVDSVTLAPTDLSNFLNCRHLSHLDLEAAKGELRRPSRYGPWIDELRMRGAAHEQAYLTHLRNRGLSIKELVDDDPSAELAERGVEATLATMREGVDVIYQAQLGNETWAGRADFLIKIDTPSQLGEWSYEVVDTKLASVTKGGTILQLCVYSHLLEELQGERPASMYVVAPGRDFEPEVHRTADYAAYFRLIKRSMDAFMKVPEDTYPDLVSHCEYCAWWEHCEKRRRADDNLCYVAGISRSQMKDLEALGVQRLAALARLKDIPDPPRGSREALTRLRDQARVQLIGRESGQCYFELKEPLDAEHGLALLPEPTPDDIFLDFEGNHFAEHGVQEYLTGYLARDDKDRFVYTALWATTLEEERQAFEHFMDAATAARKRNPGAHIYHFAPYEQSALKRLMGRFASRSVQLDELLRGGAFVDLHRVVKRALIAGVERYSIKDLEPFFGYERRQDLREATQSRRILEHAIESGMVDEDLAPYRHSVEDYNREDCESTRRLRDWLETLRRQAIDQGHDLPRPAPGGGEASEEISELDKELQRLRDALLKAIPLDAQERSPEQQAHFVLAHVLEFHRREDKASWWEYFRLRDLEEHEYADERRALMGLEFDRVLEDKKAPLQRYRFPYQELDARRDDDVLDQDGVRIGGIVDVHHAERTVDIKKTMAAAELHPTGVILNKHIRADVLRHSLIRMAEAVLADGLTAQAPYRSAVRLLLRHPSPLVGANKALQQDDEEPIAAACRMVLRLDGQVLAVQGPPGTGKTYAGGHMICALKRAGLRVGVSAVSHKVIVNLLENAMERAQEQNLSLGAVHRHDGQYDRDWGIQHLKDYAAIRQGLESGRIEVLGATAWCWAREDFEDIVDVLIVDEAGQMALSNILAAAPAGRGLVLLGDPQQLEQPLQSSHPEGSEASGLYHLLAGEETMPVDKGLFLPETWRLHPDIARFTSEVYYEGKVSSRSGLEHQAILPPNGSKSRFAGAGLRYVPVSHSGNAARAMEEVEAIAAIVTELLDGNRWQASDRTSRLLTTDDILIVAPYNAQVSALAEALPVLRERIGTVDRFQGQEAPVVIYSMTSSSPEEAPRGMAFLYDPHRFNVATSRAKAMSILVGSRALFEPECSTPRQMKMANAFCRYLELANELSLD